MVSGVLKPYLRKEVALADMYPVLASKLLWLMPENGNFVRRVETTSDAITWLKQTYTPSTDPKKELPTDRVPGTGFPEIDRTRLTEELVNLKEKGFRLRIPKKVLNDVPKAKAEIQDNYDYAAYILAEKVNTDMYADIIAQANTSTSRFSPAETWNNAGGTADPILDLTHLTQDADVDGQPFVIDSFFLNKTNFQELNDYLLKVDLNSWKQQTLYGQPTISDDSIKLPLLGTVKKAPGATEGSVLGLDSSSRVPAIEYWYNLDPDKGNPTIQYTTKVNGQAATVSADNFGFMYRWWQDQETEDIIQEFSVNFMTVVKRPYGVIYAANGI
jgi:hypothetical protein